VVGFGKEKNSSNVYMYERAVISMGTRGGITSNFHFTINDHH
jgi:hypothetical protein